jgi:hypothetical protein
VQRFPLVVDDIGAGNKATAGICVSSVPIRRLSRSDTPRLASEDPHDSGERLRPIVVHRESTPVIDGMHRLHIAVKRGKEYVEVSSSSRAARTGVSRWRSS